MDSERYIGCKDESRTSRKLMPTLQESTSFFLFYTLQEKHSVLIGLSIVLHWLSLKKTTKKFSQTTIIELFVVSALPGVKVNDVKRHSSHPSISAVRKWMQPVSASVRKISVYTGYEEHAILTDTKIVS